MYDPEQLKSFLTVARTLSFTEAATQLGLRQPTVSQHVRKLEAAVGRRLFVRDTRTVALTSDGDALAGYARSILAAHEEAVAYFTGGGVAGRLRLGVTDDLALTPLPGILRDFRQVYPRVHLELTVAQSQSLRRRVAAGHLDLAYLKMSPGEYEGRVVRQDRFVWAGTRGFAPEPGRPVPIIVYRAGALSRSIAIDSLDAAGMPYRIMCTVTGVNGILAAARAGLGISVFARSLLPDDLEEIPASSGLPRLDQVNLVLLTSPRASTEVASALTSAIVNGAGAAARLARRPAGV